MTMIRLLARVAVSLTGALLAGPAIEAPQAARYDLVIGGGTVIDGTGRGGAFSDVGVKDGRIAAIGRIARSQAAQWIDASGLVVSPGFIDVDTHADALVERPAAPNFVRMGVTTIVAGNCGWSALDVGAALAALRDSPAAVNYATLIGHNTVRSAVMGSGNRAPSPAEMARMKSLVWKAMADGAVGFSTGLQDVPGAYPQAPEIVDLARVAANAGGIYASHMRNDGTSLEQAVAETIRVGEATGARVEISHLKVDSPDRWGASAKALAMIDAARQKGIDVRADQYAYTAVSSGLGAQMVYHIMSDDDVDRIMRHPQVAVASDSGVLSFGDGLTHPRGYGDNARVLGTYVRIRHVITLEEAIRKMTSLPAAHFKFANRGVVRVGYAADLVVFDPKTVADTATVQAPHAYATGIPYVLVNGVVIVKNGTQTDARPGQVIANSLLEKR